MLLLICLLIGIALAKGGWVGEKVQRLDVPFDRTPRERWARPRVRWLRHGLRRLRTIRRERRGTFDGSCWSSARVEPSMAHRAQR